MTTHPAQIANSSGISLAMVVKDGGQFLTPLLMEAKRWVDEIIIGDTGSTDNSKDIALAAGAKVIDITWQDDFSTARNEVLRECSYNWILSIDTDEQIAPKDWQVLADFSRDARNNQQSVAVAVAIRNYLPAGTHRRGKIAVPNPDPHQFTDQAISPAFIPSTRTRLFPNSKFIEFRGIVHETVDASLREACIAVVELPVVVHNFGNLVETTQKNGFYLKLALDQTRHQPHEAEAWSHLATAAINCGDLSEALAAIDRSLILNPGNAANRLSLGWLLKKNGQLDTADMQLAAVAGLGSVSDLELAEASHMRSQIAMVQRRKDDVKSLLGIALRLDPSNGFFQNTLGVWLMSQGKTEEAKVALKNSLSSIPLEVDPWLNLGMLYEKSGDAEKALQNFQKAFSLTNDNAKLNAAIGRVTMMLENKATTKKEPCSTK